MTISIIVAHDDNRLIGRSDGSLPWHISDDLKLFKKRTIGCPIICGRKTWESLPNRPLPGRLNIILSNTRYGVMPDYSFARDLKDALSIIEDYPEYHGKDVFIIGGRQIYETALQTGIVDKMYVSQVHGEHEGDVYMPELPGKWNWELIEEYPEFELFEVTRLYS